MSSNFIYCVYLTTYSGSKLPPFYIGSSNVDRIQKGYRGSVMSQKFSAIWKSELKSNPKLFKTYIISKHTTREEALFKENLLQKKLNVIKSCMYINESYAQVRGFAGHDVSGSNNPMYRKGYKIKGSRNGRFGDSRTSFRDPNGNIVFTSPQDPRVLSGHLVGVGTNGKLISFTKLSLKFPNSNTHTQHDLYHYIYNCYINSNLKRTLFCKKHSLDYATFLKIIQLVQK